MSVIVIMIVVVRMSVVMIMAVTVIMVVSVSVSVGMGQVQRMSGLVFDEVVNLAQGRAALLGGLAAIFILWRHPTLTIGQGGDLDPDTQPGHQPLAENGGQCERRQDADHCAPGRKAHQHQQGHNTVDQVEHALL